ncbi:MULTISPECIES: flavodoxin domain-containing protein [unclassified Amycolatopsis]|uniref:flavodoxin domain-containing protein n=1 Tax=unclassified Amycolatopsis TaxID=2618356 RepID=UPI0028771FDF|nr:MULTISPECIES: flavodoxin domain-containing protein [unclassified Amycolatopsis]MDS0134711.1 flavodoxin domain-containing protein [Amycolatopsis sp. 505]MDS0147390.1 flavodoxin domain-containing protein [Amycolatopsis sp. CM201R]
MKILVAVATRHGATREIAESVATALGAAPTDAGVGAQVEVRDAGLVRSVDGFDAVVIGSAVYLGHWLEPARELVESFSDELRRVPVWLFSSGPVGEPKRPAEEPVAVEDLAQRLNARGHRLFGGKIDRRTLKFPERAVVTALRVADADNRDWPTIRAWGREIGTNLARLERSVS